MPLNNSIQVPKVLASRAYTNNLPLALEPIRHTPYAHWSSMTIMLLLRKRLCQWVNYIVKCRYFTYFRTTPKYVFGSLVRSRLLSLCDSTIVIIIETNGIHNARNYAQIALSSGYADQSHFIREFKRFTGHTPVSLSKSAYPYSDLFTDPA